MRWQRESCRYLRGRAIYSPRGRSWPPVGIFADPRACLRMVWVISVSSWFRTRLVLCELILPLSLLRWVLQFRSRSRFRFQLKVVLRRWILESRNASCLKTCCFFWFVVDPVISPRMTFVQNEKVRSSRVFATVETEARDQRASLLLWLQTTNQVVASQ